MDHRLPPPLLRRSRLLPGEALPSLLARLVRLNYYNDVPTLLTRLCLDGQEDSPAHPYLAATYERVATLTGIGAAPLHGATWHAFAPVLTPPGVEMEVVNVPGHGERPLLAPKLARRLLRLESAAQYCPACLAEAAYYRLVWLPVAAAACPRHECLLVTGCPRCGKDVPVPAVASAHCLRCGADLRQARPVSVTGDDHGLFVQRVIQAWLTAAPPPTADPRVPLLPAQPPNALFRVLDGLRWAVESARQADPAWEYACPVPAGAEEFVPALKRTRLPPAASYRVYATAFRALMDWPSGFHEFLRAYNFQEKRRIQAGTLKSDGPPYWRVDRRGLYADLGAFYAEWVQKRWDHPAFLFLQDAFDQYVVEIYAGAVAIGQSRRYRENPDRANRFPYATVAEAARMLGTTEEVISRLLQSGRLVPYKTNLAGEPRSPLVRRKELLEFQERWREALTLEETARLLGVSRRLVVDMVQARVLTAERGPDADGSSRWMFSRQVVDECVSAVEGYVKPDDGPPVWRASLVGLTAAAQSLATVGLNAVGVLRYVLEGQVNAYYPAHEPLVLGKITFAPARLEALAVKIKADHGWVTREWIAHRMGVKEEVVAKWVRSGLLAPVATFGPAQYFSEAMTGWLLSNHMMTAEAARELGVRPQTLLRWVQKGRIKPVAGPGINNCHRYLFRREDVERLRPGKRLTAPELAERMGISRGHVLRLVRQGRLRPVSGPGIDGCKHFLFEGSLEEGERLRSAVS